MSYVVAFMLGLIAGGVFGAMVDVCRTSKTGAYETDGGKRWLCYALFGMLPGLVVLHIVYALVTGTVQQVELSMELGAVVGAVLASVYLLGTYRKQRKKNYPE